jgi:head-tail adaptor
MTLHSLLGKVIQVNTLSMAQTGGKRQKSWVAKYAALPARIRPADARSVRQFGRDGQTVDHIVYVGGPSANNVANISISRGEQIVFGTRIFEVKAVRNPDELNRYLIVGCQEKKPK